MSNFYLPSTSASEQSTPAQSLSPRQSASDRDYNYDGYDDDDLDTLPYPAELPRNDFLTPDFDAQSYLSSLRNRHQTLEDLRGDLRQRSQLLSKELLDLVNSNYEEFLRLGGDLKGGEEKVESVRVGVLGFERELVNIRQAVATRLDETAGLLREKTTLKRDIMMGRRLLELHGRIDELELGLGLTADEDGEDDFDLDDDDDVGPDDGDDSVRQGGMHSHQLTGLRRNTERFLLIGQLVERIGPQHAFVTAQTTRIAELRKTLLLDLATALKQARKSGAAHDSLEIITLYGELGAQVEGVKVLKAK